MRDSRTRVALLATIVLWAAAFPAIRVAVAGYGPLRLSLLRPAIASAALLLICAVGGVRRPAARDLPGILVCGSTGVAAYQLLLNWGETHVPAGTASLLVATMPVHSSLLAWAVLGERLTTRQVSGIAVAVAGAALIALAHGGPRLQLPALAVLAAAVVQASYHVATKPLLARYTGLEVAAYATWAGTLTLAPVALVALPGRPPAPASATAALLFLGLAPSALGFTTWAYAVARLPIATATTALYLVPVVAVAIAAAWLGELPHPLELLGGAVAIGGVALNRYRHPKPKEHDVIRSVSVRRLRAADHPVRPWRRS